MADPELVWNCRVCIAQMFGGPRCLEHNPTPEQRDEREAEAERLEAAA